MVFLRWSLCVYFLLCIGSLAAQNKLSDSKTCGDEIFVYRLKIDDLHALYYDGREIGEEFLHTYITRYQDTEEVPRLPRGNYLLVRAEGNRLVYNSHIVDDLQYYFPEGKDLYLYLTDKQDEPLRDARVYLDRRLLKYDSRAGIYSAKDFHKSRMLEIEHQGVYHFVKILPWKEDIERYRAPRSVWRGIKSFLRFPRYNRKGYASFMVFSKPKYKPGETVKWKAFVASRKGVPMDKSVRVYLSRFDKPDTLLTILAPYRPGMFRYEFKLSDSLELKLDGSYYIRLHPLGAKDFCVMDYFQFREYELKGISFQVRSDVVRHQRSESPSVFLKVADENDMAVMDGRCEVTVNPSTSCEFLKSEGFVPWELWKTTVNMDTPGEKKIVLPDSIFPAGVSFHYTVNCVYLSADNERHAKKLQLYYDGRASSIRVTESERGLLLRQMTEGRPDTTMADVVGYTLEGVEVSRKTVKLPAELRVPGNAGYFVIKSDRAQTIYNLSDFKKELLSYDFYRKGNSIKLNVINPCNYPFWYALREGNSVIARGYTTDLQYKRKARGKNNYYLQIDYLLGGRIRTVSGQISTQEKRIDVLVNTPDIVYPGQKAKVELELSDFKGKPVADADVTAYAMTKKFNTASPSIPYWGTNRPDTYTYFNAKKDPEQIRNAESRMTWERWKKEMGLGSIEYYKFLHPSPVYKCWEVCPGKLTQFAPYVVLDGELQAVYMIKIDDLPYYYYGTTHFPVYSFPVSPGKHSVCIRTYDREIRLPEMEIISGVKNIVSADAGKSVPEAGLFVERLEEERVGKLSEAERTLLDKYMISVVNNFGHRELYNYQLQIEKPGFLTSGNISYYLNPGKIAWKHSKRRGDTLEPSILTGPFPHLTPVSLYVNGERINRFDAEGGYDYTIREGYLKLKQYPWERIGRELTPFVPKVDFKMHVLRAEDVLEMQDTLWRRFIKRLNSPYALDFSRRLRGRDALQHNTLQLRLNSKQDSASLLMTLFFDKNREVRQAFPGMVRRFDGLPADTLSMILVFDDDSFYERSIYLRRKGMNYLALDEVETKQDSTFSRWLDFYVRKEIYGFEEVGNHLLVQDERYTKGTKQVRGTVCFAFDGTPARGCTIFVPGKKMSTTTDVHGNFSLNLTEAEDFIVCSSRGCWNQKMKVVPGNHYYIFLKEYSQVLKEVLVTSYMPVYRRTLVSAVTSVSTGKLRGRSMSPVENLSANTSVPLIILDGKPYSGTFGDIDQSSIASLKKIAPEKAVELYGSQGANGVWVVTTSSGLAEGEAGNALRRNFHDDAFWEPALRTDREGKVSFEVTYPDDITNWQCRFIAVGDKKRTGYTEMYVKSFKAIMARLSLPRFAVQGDSINMIGKLSNYLDDTITVKQAVTINGTSREERIVFSNSYVDTIPCTVSPSDSLRVIYSLQKSDGFFDGEERVIPVYQPGCEESNGVFKVLKPDSLYIFRLDSLDGRVTVYAETTPVDLFLREIERIDIYPYLCNEQMASKLKALLIKKKIYELLGKPFEEEKKIEKLIARLTGNQNSKGLWGWWNKEITSWWISAQVTEALLAAEKAGYQVQFDRRLATECILADLRAIFADKKKLFNEEIRWLHSLMILKSLNATIDYESYVTAVDTTFTSLSLHERLLMLRMKQVVGMPVSLDSVMRYSRPTIMDNLCWRVSDADVSHYRFHPDRDAVQSTLLAYQILRDMGGQSDKLERIRNYFFEIRGGGFWRNIYESSRVMETILPDMLADKSLFSGDTRLLINGESIDKFPFTREFASGEELHVRREGTLPVFFTAYQTSWNTSPVAMSKGFDVKTSFKQHENEIQELAAGEMVDIVVEVNAHSDAEYVMIEIPIPAGCTYASENYNWWSRWHKEYRKEKVAIFCKHLEEGKYTFSIPLIPRFTGRYHLNPAKVELMYFPIFYGREGMRMTDIR